MDLLVGLRNLKKKTKNDHGEEVSAEGEDYLPTSRFISSQIQLICASAQKKVFFKLLFTTQFLLT